MHPTRVARFLALVGMILLLGVIFLRGVSLSGTFNQVMENKTSLFPDPWIPTLGNYTISSDGTQLYFLSAGNSGVSDPPTWYTMSVNGGPVTVTEKPQADLSPFLLSNGQVYITQAGEKTLVSGSSNNLRVTEAVRSPNEQFLAYAALLPNGKRDLYMLSVSGELNFLGEENNLFDIAWSPDSQYIAFIAPRNGTDQVLMLDQGGQELKQITADPTRKSRPRWSPDGKSLIFPVHPYPKQCFECLRRQGHPNPYSNACANYRCSSSRRLPG